MIAVDLDGVVTNFIGGYTRLANRLVGAPVITDYNQVLHWEPRLWYAPQHYTNELNERIWREIKSSPFFWQDLLPLFPEAMLFLNHHRRDIVFMTRRDGHQPWEQTVYWLTKNGIREPLVIRIQSGEEKHVICRKIGIKWMVEDSPTNIAKAQGSGVHVAKMIWPYNQYVESDYASKDLFALVRRSLDG